MNETEQTEDVLNMVGFFENALINALSPRDMSPEMAAILKCLQDWADLLETGGNIDMSTEHWQLVQGESK